MERGARKEVVEAIRGMAEEVVEMIRDEMMKTEGFTWGIDLGFHAEPSMRLAMFRLTSEKRADKVDTCIYTSFRVIGSRHL